MQYLQIQPIESGIVPLPSAGSFNTFLDNNDNKYKGKDADGNVILLGGEGAVIPSNLETVSNISDLLNFNKTGIDLIIVTDKKTGGYFEPYSGSFSSDGGVVFIDANSNKWKRIITTNYINIDWYGAKLVTIPGNDDIHDILILAINAATNTEIISSGKVYIPSLENSGEFYYCSDRIVIDKTVEIFGDGPYKSHIRFSNTGGFKFNYVTSRNSKLNNLHISGNDRNAFVYGIEFKDIILCENVVVSTFGDGFYANNSIPTGNSNNSQFTNCEANENGIHGFNFKGPDANAMKLINCSAVANGGLGVCDQSFLGNHYLGLHSATNGSPELPWQKGLIKIGTDLYACIYDNTQNIEPGVTVGWENYWYHLTDPNISYWITFPNVLDYNPSTNYHAVGAWNLDGFSLAPLGLGQNQSGTFSGGYMESDQAPAYIGARIMSVGGNGIFRGDNSSLNSANNSIYTSTPIYSGSIPGTVGGANGVISKNGVGVIDGLGQSAILSLNDTYKTAVIITNINSNYGSTMFTSPATTNAMFNRTAGIETDGNLALSRSVFMTSFSDRQSYHKLDLTRVIPPTTNLEQGDIFICTSKVSNELKADNILLKYTESYPGGEKKIYPIKGYQEDILTNVSGDYFIGIDSNISDNRGILYDLQFVGSDLINDCIIHREILITKRLGFEMSVIDNTPIRPDFIPGNFATTAFQLTSSDSNYDENDVSLKLINLPPNTNGKIHIKRIDY